MYEIGTYVLGRTEMIRVRRLGNGTIRTVHDNRGLRKICRCPRRRWSGCSHAWHFSFRWRARAYRFSLDRYAGHHVESRSEADALADQIRTAIRDGTFNSGSPEAVPAAAPTMTFCQLSDLWSSRYGYQLASARNDGYRLRQITTFMLTGYSPPVTIGNMPANSVALVDIESYRDHRKAAGLSPVSINQDLRLLRKIFNWGIRKGCIDRTPFKIGTEPAIQLEREIPRHRRFDAPDDEDRLLAATSPHLHGVIVALLETACRVGEILDLQWGDVALDRRELTIRAEKTKTRTERLIPISSRLKAILEMRRVDPAGQLFRPDAYVFGDVTGARVKSVRRAWEGACSRAGLSGFQLRDLRHEAGSRFDEAGVPVNFVSRLLGHTNLTTTSRYLNIHRRGLHMAMQKFEESRRLASLLQDPPQNDSATAGEPQQEPAAKPSVSSDLQVVRKRGFEPPRPCGHKLLRLARLPVPPLPHEEVRTTG
jgi:integrase